MVARCHHSWHTDVSNDDEIPMQSSQKPPRLLTTEQVVEKLNALGMEDVKKRTITRWCAAGLRYAVVGGKRRFREDYIDGIYQQWVEEAT